MQTQDRTLFEKPLKNYEWKVTFRGKRCGHRFGRFEHHVEYVHATCADSAEGALLEEFVIHGDVKVECLGEVEPD